MLYAWKSMDLIFSTKLYGAAQNSAKLQYYLGKQWKRQSNRRENVAINQQSILLYEWFLLTSVFAFYALTAYLSELWACFLLAEP